VSESCPPEMHISLRCVESDPSVVYEGSRLSTQTEEWIQNERDVTLTCGGGRGQTIMMLLRSLVSAAAPNLSGGVREAEEDGRPPRVCKHRGKTVDESQSYASLEQCSFQRGVMAKPREYQSSPPRIRP